MLCFSFFVHDAFLCISWSKITQICSNEGKSGIWFIFWCIVKKEWRTGWEYIVQDYKKFTFLSHWYSHTFQFPRGNEKLKFNLIQNFSWCVKRTDKCAHLLKIKCKDLWLFPHYIYCRHSDKLFWTNALQLDLPQGSTWYLQIWYKKCTTPCRSSDNRSFFQNVR